MPVEWAYAIVSVTIVSLLSLTGVVVIAISERTLRRTIFVMVSLAAGAMFGDALIHLLPESFGKSTSRTAASASSLAGIFMFFILEKFLLWRHSHPISEGNQIHPVGYMNLAADAIHNFMDGTIIGASYLVSVQVGIATTLAVILHEIPHELGDFFILLYAGFTKTRALLFNFLSACLAVLGAVLTLVVGSRVAGFTSLALPFAAGGFIYIAGSDLLPELQKELKPARSALQLVAMLAGVGLMLLLTVVG